MQRSRSTRSLLFSRSAVSTLLLGMALVLTGCNSSTAESDAPTVNMTLPNFTQLVQDNASSVVNISTTHKVTQKGHSGLNRLGHMFRQFFGDKLGDKLEKHWNKQHPKHHARKIRSLGSGFIISKDGYILTNYHVVKDADSILVRLNNHRQLPAKLIGKDKLSDLALLKIDADHLNPVTIGSSHDLKAGQWVLAIGAPFGFDSSVTAGIVSAKNRSLPDSNYVPFIQTDVAINPGNSGGPLFNLKGEVVGINSQIISRSGGYMGLSFAVPIDLAMKVVKRLKAGKQVQRGWLGVAIQSVTYELAQSFGLDKPEGALVARVMPDSPAQKAGLKTGDVIITFDGTNVVGAADLPPLVGLVPPGAEVEVGIIRGGDHKTLDVTLGKLPADKGKGQGSAGDNKQSKLGLEVAPLNGQSDDATHGVKVTEVSPGPAARAGISRGDVIESINNQAVNSVDDFNQLLEKYKDHDTLALLVSHSGRSGFVVVHK